MTRAAALLLLLSACTRTPAAGCGRDADCGSSATCIARSCVAAGAVPYEVEFLIVPPAGSTLAPALRVDPCLHAANASACVRQLAICDFPRLGSDARPDNARLVGRGSLNPDLDLVQDVDVTFKHAGLSIPLLPGSWKMIYFPQPGAVGNSLAPTFVQFPVGDCDRGVSLLDNLYDVARNTDTYGMPARQPYVDVRSVVDNAHDPRPFCDAVLDAVDSPKNGRVVSNVITLPNMGDNKDDAPVCTSATNGGTLYIDHSVDTPWLRIRPRNVGDPAAPVQFLKIQTSSIIVDSRAAMPNLHIEVVDADNNGVVGAKVHLAGNLDPPDADASQPRFATSDAEPIGAGVYRTSVPPGCYSIRVEPPPGTMQSVAIAADMVDGGTDTTCTVPGQIHVRPGGVARAQVVLAQRNKLTVTVESTTKDPVFGAIVTAIPRGAGRTMSATSGADGAALLNLDADQDYDIDVAPTTGDLARQYVKVVNPKSPVLTVDLPHAIRVVGQLVQAADFSGLAGASVQAFASPIHAGARPLGEAVTDEDGRFRLLLPPSLPPMMP